MSGSPILSENGSAVGVVVAGGAPNSTATKTHRQKVDPTLGLSAICPAGFRVKSGSVSEEWNGGFGRRFVDL
jgi:hypothetical protein